jgi:hypothetical protein
VAKRRRQQSSHVLHQKKFGPEGFDEPKVLPKQSATVVRDRAALARSAEGRAGRTTYKHVEIVGLEARRGHQFSPTQSRAPSPQKTVKRLCIAAWSYRNPLDLWGDQRIYFQRLLNGFQSAQQW